ncbi:MAG TPA: D-alanyl-D-alanine carboxypeptidase/D-alanyl-D-alanine-endopeptidase [Solirubrobacterales bacterium]|nr:D-alanyl-D-alanine carboxypeptidase/D-alanyl-D-alanine-endopeptidase [Solirubrobacterales bacterium]
MPSARLMLATAAAVLTTAPAAFAATLGPDQPAVTPAAKPGSELAARADLSRGELRDELAAALADDGSAGGAWVFDTEATGDAVLFSDNGSREMIPASNQKLFVTAALLAELGPTARLETRVYARGKLGGRGDSVVGGDLVLVGDGDPSFGTGRFARANDQPATRVSQLARNVAAAGVKRVEGRILADDSIFDRERRAGPDLSPLSGLSFNNGYDGGDYAQSPELVAAKGLKSALRKRGVRVDGQVGRANLPAATLESEPLAAVASPTVAKLIEETNVPSNNFFAEMLLKRLAATSGRKGTRHRGNDKVETFAASVGTAVESVDGSGLSRKNRVSPEHVGQLLVAMAKDEQNAAAFRDSLPVAGREGTVADRMRGTAAEGNCATKTGTLSDVSALSGYCEAGGHTVVFSTLMNDANVDAARGAQDRIAAAVARYQP